MFLAGGDKEKEQGLGLPGSFATRRGAYLARPARGGTEASRGIEGDVEGKGTMSQWENKVDIQTTELCSLVHAYIEKYKI
jgi:hypothetical protein